MKKLFISFIIFGFLFIAQCVFAVDLDTQNKRRSSVYIPPVPSGAISIYDRRQIGNVYALIPSSTNPRRGKSRMGLGLQLN